MITNIQFLVNSTNSIANLGRRKLCKESRFSFKSSKLSTREVPVIFLNDVATGLISHFAAAISGGSLYRKSSFLLDHLGKQVLPDWFNISERPHLLRRLASTPFDSEGVRTQDREIVEGGILQTYLVTSYSGKKNLVCQVQGMLEAFTTGLLSQI